MDIPKRIKELTENHGLASINELSRLAAIPQSTLATLMLGDTSPRVDTIQRICTALDITLAEFFSEDKPHLADLAKNIKSLTDNASKASDRLIEKLRDPVALNYIVEHELPKVRAAAIEQYGENAKSVKDIDRACAGSQEEKIQLILLICEDIEKNIDGTWNLIIKGSSNPETASIIEKFNSLGDRDRQLVRLMLDFLGK